jgi:uncharacterized Zn-finger protein
MDYNCETEKIIEVGGKPVYCPRCKSLTGLMFDVEQPKIDKIRLEIGGKKYPVVDVKKMKDAKITCTFCGHRFPLIGMKRLSKSI